MTTYIYHLPRAPANGFLSLTKNVIEQETKITILAATLGWCEVHESWELAIRVKNEVPLELLITIGSNLAWIFHSGGIEMRRLVPGNEIPFGEFTDAREGDPNAPG